MNKSMLTVAIILLAIILIVWFFIVGGVEISFRPFHFAIKYWWNILGWSCIIVAGIAFGKHYKQRANEDLKEQVESIEKLAQDELEHIANNCKDVIIKQDSIIKELKVELNKYKNLEEHGN